MNSKRSEIRYIPRLWIRLSAACVLAVTWLLVSSLARAQTPVDYQPGVRLGQGFETLDDSVRGECVVYELDDSGPVAAAQGQTQDYRLFEVADSYQMTQVMQLSLSAKYKSGFGTAAEGKASIARNQNVTQFSNTFIARMSVRNAVPNIVRVKLKDAMATLARTSPADFRQRCGNQFVSGVITGGEFIGYVSIETRNQSEQEKISAAYNARYGLGGTFQSEGTFDKEFLEKIESRRKTVEVHQSGGTSEFVNDVASMFRKLEGFTASVSSAGAVPYQASLQLYQTLPNFPVSADIGQKEMGLERILDRAWQLRSIAEDIRYIRGHRDEFVMGTTTPAALGQLATTITTQLTALETAATTCRTTAQCIVPAGPSPDDVRDQLPVRYRAACKPVDVTVDPFRIDAFVKTAGDTDMKGNRPKISLAVDLRLDAKNLLLNGRLKIRESKKDWTTFEGRRGEIVVHTLQSADLEHCRYNPTQVGLVLSGSIEAQAAKDEHRTRPYQGSGLVKSAQCMADTKGDDAGKLFCENIVLIPLHLSLLHEEEFHSMTQRKRENDLRRQRFKSIGEKHVEPAVRPPRDRFRGLDLGDVLRPR